MVVTRSGMDTSHEGGVTEFGEGSRTPKGVADPPSSPVTGRDAPPPSPLAEAVHIEPSTSSGPSTPRTIPPPVPSPMEAMMKAMMDMMMMQETQRLAVERERIAMEERSERERIAIKERRLAAEAAREASRDQSLQDLARSVLSSRAETSDTAESSRRASSIHESSPLVEKMTFSKYNGKMDAAEIFSWIH